MNSLDLPKPQQDFMKTVRSALQVRVERKPEIQGHFKWMTIEDRADEMDAISDHILGTVSERRGHISDTLEMRLQIDSYEIELFELLERELGTKSPEKKDNAKIIDLRLHPNRERYGLHEPLPPDDILRGEYMKYFGLTSEIAIDPRTKQVVDMHKRLIQENPAKGFGAMTNWISRFPDFIWLYFEFDKVKTRKDRKRLTKRMNRNHPWLYPETRLNDSANYLPCMYISAAIDNTSDEDKNSVLNGIEESRKVWRKFWESVMMEAEEA